MATIERGAGRAQLFARQLPLLLETLAHRARIESVRASSAIEQVTVPGARLHAVVDRGASPRNRSEAEVAGYRDALDLVLRSTETSSAMTTPLLLRLHGRLWAHTESLGGQLREADNRVVDIDPDGMRVDRFRTVPARDTKLGGGVTGDRCQHARRLGKRRTGGLQDQRRRHRPPAGRRQRRSGDPFR